MAADEVGAARAGAEPPGGGAEDPAAAQGPATTTRTSCSRSAPARAATRPSLFAAEIFRMYIALRRVAGLEGGDQLGERLGHRRLQGSHRADQRRQGLQQAEVRKRRAPRAARAGHRAAGPRPHLRDHRGRAPRGRRGRGPDRPQGHPHRHVLLLRPRRPVRQHDLLGGAHHAPADRTWWFPARTRSRRSRTAPRRCACSAAASTRWNWRNSAPRSARSAAAWSAAATAARRSAPTTSRRTASPTTASGSPCTSSTCIMEGRLDPIIDALTTTTRRRS